MPDDFRDLPDLAGERLGGAAVYATDDYFAEKENLLKPDKPVWKEHEYTSRGKWMDGWESRRKRTPGHDFCVIRLGLPGVIRGVVVDTSFFRGNFPEAFSLDGYSTRPETEVDSLLQSDWTDVLPRTPLKGDSENMVPAQYPYAVSHLRFNIFPDGGVARLRVHGSVLPEWRRVGGLRNELDLAAVEHGGEVLQCSDMFFGPKHNLIMPGRAHNMSDGWETRRRRGPGHDWVVVRLGVEAVVRRIEVDTAHFKGNYPDTASLEGSSDGKQWSEILPRTKMQAHTRHLFLDELQNAGPLTQVRLNVFPDGGVSRLRVYGTATERARKDEVARRVSSLHPTRAAEELHWCCGSSAWVQQMLAARPFRTWDELTAAGDKIWSRLGKEDWLEAFRSHPRIGEKGRGWAAGEQSGVRDSQPFLEANREYEKRFGHIYIVRATGRSGDEMLSNLRERLGNDPDQELRIAAAEQAGITKLRLEKLVF
jgi:allantoicase